MIWAVHTITFRIRPCHECEVSENECSFETYADAIEYVAGRLK